MGKGGDGSPFMNLKDELVAILRRAADAIESAPEGADFSQVISETVAQSLAQCFDMIGMSPDAMSRGVRVHVAQLLTDVESCREDGEPKN